MAVFTFVMATPLSHCTTTRLPRHVPTRASARRCAGYRRTLWKNDYLQALRNDYKVETFTREVEKLKEEIRIRMDKIQDPLGQLELVDTLQRLGLAYHFGSEMDNILQKFCNNKDTEETEHDLYATALRFRILRQHGFHISQGIFERYMEKNGHFSEDICHDGKGMLSLYEASYYSLEDEDIMEEAWRFTTKNLRGYLEGKVESSDLETQIRHALDLPLHWRPPRLEARWFIDHVSKNRKNFSSTLLHLAKLDYNIVQGIHREDLADASRWWKKSGAAELKFVRDRLVPTFLWAVGTAHEPQHSFCRKVLALTASIVTIIDDIYDVYGTLEELELFKDAFDRWDPSAVTQLPDLMKKGFYILYHHINETASEIHKKKGFEALPHLRKLWVDLLGCYLLEARWYHNGYKPTLEEYLTNGSMSISGLLIAATAYLAMVEKIDEVALDYLRSYQDLPRLMSLNFRLVNDLGNSSDEMKRGDVFKSVQCYMNDVNVCEEASRKHIRDMARQIWKKLNRYRVADSPLSRASIEATLNILRMAHLYYLHDGDGYAIEDYGTRDLVESVLLNPIPLYS